MLVRTEMAMVIAACGVKLLSRKRVKKLIQKLGLKEVID